MFSHKAFFDFFHNRRPNPSRIGRGLFVLLALAGWLLNPLGSPTALADNTPPPAQSVSLGQFLDEDGNLKLPSFAIQGSIDPAGYALVSGPGEAPRFAPMAGSDNANWDAQFTLPGVNNYVYALAWDGANLYVGGWFNSVGALTANAVARWDGVSWSTLGTGMNNPVNALLWNGTHLYAGGAFSTAGGVPANRVARWDGSNWSALGSGIGNGIVYALAWDGINLYVGGSFTNPGYRIARWDGSSWGALGSGIDSTQPAITDLNAVYALAWDGAELYAGGIFTVAGAVTANHIARWNGSAWNTLGSGMNSYVFALAWTGSQLYAGGYFTNAGGTPANYIARWNGSAWSTLGSGTNAGVWALSWDGAALYVGGGFTNAGGSPANFIARWNGSSWNALGSGVNYYVNALASTGTHVYAGGDFAAAGGKAASYVADWNGAAWNSLGNGEEGVSQFVYALAWDGVYLYAGGDFTAAGGGAANNIARWDGKTWSALGSGMNNRVSALLWNGTHLFAGGSFTSAGGVSVSNIARWDGSNWAALGSGTNGSVYALAWDGSSLYAGGAFTSPGNRVARWNGSNWSALGSGMNATVRALAWDGAGLYAGGEFTSPSSYLARWNGSTWNAVGGGVNDRVWSLAWDGVNLYAGGDFVSAGGSPANRVARWDGSAWNALGGGANGRVYALAWYGGQLYAGGEFSTPAGRVARWDGLAWNSLGSSLSGSAKPILNTPPVSAVFALTGDSANPYPSLWAGGAFVFAGDKVSNYLARWRHAAIWDGGGGNSNGSDPANWSGNSLPGTTDAVIFDRTSSAHAVMGAGFPATLAGLAIEDSYSGVITQTASLHVTGQFSVRGGVYVVPDPASASLTVGGAVVHSGGVLRQTRSINADNVAFLQIEDGAAVVRYRGAEVNASLSAANLGNVTITIRAADRNAGEYCTTTAGSSPVYTGRCYQITPTADGAARVRLWALSSELNSIPAGSLSVYRNTSGASWAELVLNRVAGNDGGNYRYAEGDTSGFSSFLLGQQGSGPTAITVQHFSGRSEASVGYWLPGIGLLACLLLGAAWRRRSR